MNIAIYGAGVTGKYVINQIEDRKRHHITCIIDNYKPLEKQSERTDILTLEEFSRSGGFRETDTVLICIKYRPDAQDAVISLLQKGFTGNIYIPILDIAAVKMQVFDENDRLCGFTDYKEIQPTLRYLEYQVSDICNLNCKACMHFSNLPQKDRFPQLEDFERSAERIHDLFGGILKIRLMGGEPLLNKELPGFVEAARRYFPYSDLRIVTNGLLIMGMSRELIQSMHRNSAGFDISVYPKTKDHITEIVSFLNDNRIEFCLGESIDGFIVRLDGGENDPKDVFDNHCLSKECTILRNGKVYICPHIPFLFEQREYFGFDISSDEFAKNGMSLDECNNGWDVLFGLKHEYSMCRFCSNSPETIPWETGAPKQSDWYPANN